MSKVFFWPMCFLYPAKSIFCGSCDISVLLLMRALAAVGIFVASYIAFLLLLRPQGGSIFTGLQLLDSYHAPPPPYKM